MRILDIKDAAGGKDTAVMQAQVMKVKWGTETYKTTKEDD
jgi:hypothetical protein